VSIVYSRISSIILDLVAIAMDDKSFNNLDELLEDLRIAAENQIRRKRNQDSRDRLMTDISTRLKTIIDEDELEQQ
jgi:hypothetical protein